MAASSKFDLSSGSLDRPLYASGQRGSYSDHKFNRSMDFKRLAGVALDPKAMIADHKFFVYYCEGKFDLSSGSLDRPLYASGQRGESYSISSSNMSRSTSAVTHGDITLHLVLQKTNLVLHCSRKSNVSSLVCSKSSIKARERVKIFNEGLSVFNKCFPGMPSRKRSRSDVLSGDRSSVLFSSDRSVIGPTVGKMGARLCFKALRGTKKCLEAKIIEYKMVNINKAGATQATQKSY
ncbi:hypothetical protein POM88_001665 [Heracleum sosnowskyi]|uniref:Uncharacterized protein n=1 Tax=Heracleum sosnowskyi TaxID=360622 RepID=A0AAD8N579_9APIA|nr:hypothetical protein POM88_001665 [Heracleum sosnowskyi]